MTLRNLLFNTRLKYSSLLVATTLMLWACGGHGDTLTIGIQPLGPVNAALIDTVATALASEYGARVYILPTRPLPDETFTNVKSPRYRAAKLIRILRDNKPDSLDHVLGLTTKDISITDKDALGRTRKPESKYEDWGVFGYGYRPGASCIVSTQRLRTPSKAKSMLRLKKIAIHEVGHNLGLDHCTSPKCVMHDAAETVRTVDTIDAKICGQCRAKVN